jgi:hypothetical protein
LSPENIDGDEEANQSFWIQAYRNLKLGSRKVALKYDSNRKPHQYHVGDTAMYRLNFVGSKTRNISAKLLFRWSKPVIVTRIVRPNVVLLAYPETGVIVRRAHVSQLKPYVK